MCRFQITNVQIMDYRRADFKFKCADDWAILKWSV
jgi:hypothetical protein